MGQWKGVATDKVLALYNLDKDIGEERNVAEEHPEIARRMTTIIAELE
jgi:arylsulfatase